MIADIDQYRDMVKNGDPVGKDVTDTMLELDVTNSRVTQADLNQDLVCLYKRLQEKPMEVEAIGKDVTAEQFAQWVNDNFTAYSADLFNRSI